jgi:hypothetical protein
MEALHAASEAGNAIAVEELLQSSTIHVDGTTEVLVCACASTLVHCKPGPMWTNLLWMTAMTELFGLLYTRSRMVARHFTLQASVVAWQQSERY